MKTYEPCKDFTPSIGQNYFYNTLLTVINLLFPLITFPYISRILGPEGMGKVSFALAICQQFLLFANLGIPLYGVREIAKYQSDKSMLSKVYSELLVINFISMLIILCIYYGAVFYIEKFHNEKILFLIFSLNILLSAFTLDWFYKGIENFRYITIRSIIVKIISLIVLFIFVKNENNYSFYAVCIVIAMSGANIFNFFYSKKLASFSFAKLNLRRHFKGIMTTFLIFAVIQFYIGMDKIMIGFISGDIYVGFYTVAERIDRILITLVISLSAVLIPKMSFHHSNNEQEKFNNLLDLSIKYVLLLSVPIIAGIFFLNTELILLFAGEKYAQSYLSLKILSFLIILVGLANVSGMQILYSTGQEKKYLVSITFGMVLSIIANLILIPKFQHNGAAAGTLIAECAGLAIQLIFCWRIIHPILVNWSNLKYFLSTAVMCICLIFANQIKFADTVLIKVISYPLVGALIYFLILLILKEKIIFTLLKIKKG